MILKPFFSSHWWQAICPYPWVYKSSSKNDPNIHTLHKPLHIEELYLLVCHYEPNQPWNKSWDYHTPMGAFDTAFFVIIIINALIHIMWGWNWKAQCFSALRFMLTLFLFDIHLFVDRKTLILGSSTSRRQWKLWLFFFEWRMWRKNHP